ncbi:unnamed protein product [Trypanosoma congolense IL3000]|uniref:beta-ketoacyl-[acyl-carrier-protein] synthase I n=1 Tax=Trypanosoma congolense (strain IL3000) TaxID=1068625 RepID=F9W7Z7_TRYCI|nr:unnamed protein product [Trypanosoma congolense IL3000]
MSFGSFPPQIRRRVAVTGLGAVTPLGLNVPTTWAALCQGKSATRSLECAPFFFPSCIETDRRFTAEEHQKRRQDLLAAMPCKVAATVTTELDSSNLSDGNQNNLSKDKSCRPNFAPTSRETRATRFALHAVEEALVQAGLLKEDAGGNFAACSTSHVDEKSSEKDVSGSVRAANRFSPFYPSERVGVNLGVGMPSLSDVCDAAYYLYADPTRVKYGSVNPLFVPKILGNMLTGLVAVTYGLHGPVSSTVGACATGAQCIGEAAGWIQRDRADIVICGSAEACITPTAIAGFSRMRALCTKYNDRPHEASRPFDKDRAGFVMGEGAGVMILESLEHAQKRGARILAELRGFGVSCDAHDVAAPHPDGYGAKLCIQDALRDGGNVPAGRVGYVNAHATGTIGDDLELRAIDAVLNNNGRGAGRSLPLHVSSVKGGIGHLLGAAGSVEALVAVMALHNQRAPPNINFHEPSAHIPEGIELVQGNTTRDFKSEAVLSTSFGFGGVNTALLFTSL